MAYGAHWIGACRHKRRIERRIFYGTRPFQLNTTFRSARVLTRAHAIAHVKRKGLETSSSAANIIIHTYLSLGHSNINPTIQNGVSTRQYIFSCFVVFETDEAKPTWLTSGWWTFNLEMEISWVFMLRIYSSKQFNKLVAHILSHILSVRITSINKTWLTQKGGSISKRRKLTRLTQHSLWW